jgi:putative colanic acid biosynthesis glycosyltransferase WcaI
VPLRLVVHDYSGHPFQVQLSRELARRGHRVLHLHCPSYRTGKGDLELRADDPATLSIDAISLDETFHKYSPRRRIMQERTYGRRLLRRLADEQTDVIVSSNTPLLAQDVLLSGASAPVVFWHQDVYSLPMKAEAERRLPPVVGPIVGRRFVDLERKLLDRSAAVVTISEDFRETLLSWGLPPHKLHVVENWAPLEELPDRPKDNEWARRHGLADKRVLLYSGTLGRKHDPSLLLRLAAAFRDESDVRVVVASEGLGADWLRERARENLVLLGFQPYDELPDVLGTGDALLVILERDAGKFAVPSKVLSYLCARRPLLAALPPDNLAARVIHESSAGIVVEPDDAEGLEEGARRLLSDPGLRERLGAEGRSYAERTFDIRTIGDRFEVILESVASGTQVPSPA